MKNMLESSPRNISNLVHIYKVKIHLLSAHLHLLVVCGIREYHLSCHLNK